MVFYKHLIICHWYDIKFVCIALRQTNYKEEQVAKKPAVKTNSVICGRYVFSKQENLI